MSKYDLLTHEYVLSILHYDKETGIFTWRERSPDMFKDGKGRYTKERNCKVWNSKFAGKQTGFEMKKDNRKQIRINNILYYANVIAWLYVTGSWPNKQVDHIDKDASNDAFENLRLATNAENSANKGKNKNNKTGYKGVCFDKSRNNFIASITKNRKQIMLGRYKTLEEAHDAYCKAAKELFGEFARVA